MVLWIDVRWRYMWWTVIHIVERWSSSESSHNYEPEDGHTSGRNMSVVDI
jgi:hypothetical protein